MPHLSASDTVNVKYKPEITVIGYDYVNIITGTDFVLNCSYQANPSVSARVIWYRDGKHLDLSQLENVTSDGAVIKMLKGSSHSISISGKKHKWKWISISATRASSGLYSCRVENDIGSSEVVDIAYVNVQDVPEVFMDIIPKTPIRWTIWIFPSFFHDEIF